MLFVLLFSVGYNLLSEDDLIRLYTNLPITCKDSGVSEIQQHMMRLRVFIYHDKLFL